MNYVWCILTCHVFIFICFKIHSNMPCGFFIDPWINVYYVVSKYLGIFHISFGYWFLSQFPCGQRTYFVWFEFFLIILLFSPQIRSNLVNIYVYLRRMCILLYLGSIFYTFQIRSNWLIVLLKTSTSLLIFCILVLSVIKRGFWSLQL